MNWADTRSFASHAPHGFVLVKHLRGEAAMRFRSLSSCPAPTRARRTRSSKHQNNVVSLHGASGPGSLPMFAELQPLARRCAATIATSHHKIIMCILTAAFSAPAPAAAGPAPSAVAAPAMLDKQIIHVLVGDGVEANNMASKIIWDGCRATTNRITD